MDRRGSSVARAVGVSSSSTCQPNCATGRRINSPVRITVSNPGRFLGYEVYRCFQLVFPSLPRSDEHECIGRLEVDTGTSTPSAAAFTTISTTAAEFYSVPGWSCGMNSGRDGMRERKRRDRSPSPQRRDRHLPRQGDENEP